MTGSERFHQLLETIGQLHDKKQADYGRPNDPFANVRASEDFGVPGWVGALVRANDKMRRLQTAANGGTLSNEGVEDSLMDLAVYALIALVLYEEEQEGVGKLDSDFIFPSKEWGEWEAQWDIPTSEVLYSCTCGDPNCPGPGTGVV